MANIISMRNFIMSASNKRMLLTNPEFIVTLARFLNTFEAVFGDADWPVTLANLQDDAKYLIHPNGTFLEPGVADEDANWHNRGSLLAGYRDLKAALDGKNFNIVELHPCGAVTKARSRATEPADEPDDAI